VLVEPKYGGNIGAIARAMMNFDFTSLYLVNPCTLDDECYARAMHAQPILDNACLFSSFTDAIANIDYLIATSSIESLNEKRHLRNAFVLHELAEKIGHLEGTVGLVFGREDYGLYNEEIAACDALLKIPTSEAYSSMNLSHAVSLVLYTLYIQTISPKKRRTIGKLEKEKLYDFFTDLLEEIRYPKHKKENTEIMFKRIMGRAMPSTWEYHTLMGVFSRAVEQLKHKKK